MARHQFAVVALLVIALASSCWVLLDVAGDYSKSSTSFGVPSFENRYNDLRKIVTPQSQFGYTSDNAGDDVNDQAEFYLTQYTLAPAILTTSTIAPQVVVNLHNPDKAAAVLDAKHLALIRNYDNGVMLCRPAAAR